jgi:hypothetical protein
LRAPIIGVPGRPVSLALTRPAPCTASGDLALPRRASGRGEARPR